MDSEQSTDYEIWLKTTEVAERRRRWLVATVGIALTSSIVAFGLGWFITKYEIPALFDGFLLQVTGFILFLGSIGALSYYYAQHGSLFASPRVETQSVSAWQRTVGGAALADVRVLERELRARNEALASRLNEMAAKFDEKLADGGNVGLSEDDRNRVITELRKTLVSEASASLVEEVRESLERQKRSTVEGLAAEQIAITQSRLGTEIRSLVRTGSINLALGTVTTSMALFLLGFFVFTNTVKFQNMVDVASHYLPRVTLVIFIQAFALFFLKLYKATLADIKYYQNELTTVEGRAIGVALALHGGDDAGLNDAISQQLRMERNRILEKGQSTVEIQRAQIAAARDRRLIDVLKAAVGRGRS